MQLSKNLPTKLNRRNIVYEIGVIAGIEIYTESHFAWIGDVCLWHCRGQCVPTLESIPT